MSSPERSVPFPAPTTAACTAISRDAGEPQLGTAPPMPAAWLLLEHPGPWDDAAARMQAVPAAVREGAARHGLLLALIRRHGRRVVRRPTVVLARPTHAGGVATRLTVERLEQVADLDLAGVATGGPLPGTPVDEPLVLACTNGRVDPCCARLGRPVAGALSRRFGTRVWESTHVGGCRFAGNVVCLPHGLYFGRLTPDDAVATVAELLAGRLRLEGLRGRAGWPAPAQVADAHLRRHRGIARLDGTRLRRCEEDDGWAEVSLAAGAERWELTLEQRQVTGPLPAGHGRERTLEPASWEVRTLVAEH